MENGQQVIPTINRNDLRGLCNLEIAKKLYCLIDAKDLDDLFEIGEYIKIIAVNKKG